MRVLHALCAILLTLGWVPAAAGEEEFPYEARVAAPAADLRKEPVPPGLTLEHDPLEESQLLQGDRVIVLEEKMGWARVSVPDQQEWTHHKRWEGYPGWIQLSDLVREDGTRKPASAARGGRKAIVRAAREFLGTPYYWGGRSAQGVDCSGLTGLAYQQNGVQIPRDAHEQWMKARKIRRDQLQPADLVFLSDPKDPEKITHVMLYAGEGKVIEGPGTGKNVRETGLDERLKEADGRQVHYGTYF